MPARLTAYLPERAAISRLLETGERVLIGRGEDCDLRIEHASVSRRHAVLVGDADETWRLTDLGSKNGSFIDGQPAADTRLTQAAWLRLGDVYCEFAPLAPDEAARSRQRQRERQGSAVALTARLSTETRLGDLLDGTLRAVVELAECRRGFLLLGANGDLAVVARLGLEPDALAGREFSGSVGVVRRVLAEARPVVVNDIGTLPWLASRESVVAAGLHTVVCLPLLDEGVAIGAVYADRREPGPPITALDLELLQALTERAALWIAGRRLDAALDAHDRAVQDQARLRWDGILAAHDEHAR